MRIDAHSLLVLICGQGVLDIDFHQNPVESGEVLSLGPGQFVRLTGGRLTGVHYEFSADEVSYHTNTRFLFRHLTGVAHVAWQDFKNELAFETDILDQFVQKWQVMNPFSATDEEVDLLFLVKELIDEQFREPLSVGSVALQLHRQAGRINTLLKQKTGHTVKQLHQQKLLLEARRQVIFSTATTKGIGYDLGFSEPAYFNRFFKQYSGQSPGQFRDRYAVTDRDPFLPDLLALIEQYAFQPHSVEFYAQKLFMTGTTLARKAQLQSGKTIQQLIQNKWVSYAKTMLTDGLSSTEVAFNLGFSEPSHFSTFFKNMTGQTPTEFRTAQQKVQSFVKYA